MPDPLSARQPRGNRISISVGPELYERLRTLSVEEGRSLSNLCVHLLEGALTRIHR